MRRIRPQSTSMFIVTATSNEFAYFNNMRFTSFSGIKDKTISIPYVSPFYHREYQIPTHRSYDPVTLAMPYNSQEHFQVFNNWNRYQNETLLVRIEPVTGCQTGLGEETSLGYVHELTGCIWVACDTVNVERGENQIVLLTIQFTFTRAEDLEI